MWTSQLRSFRPLLFALVAGILGTLGACASVRVPEADLLDASGRIAYVEARDAYLRGDDEVALELVGPILERTPLHLAGHGLRQDALRSLGRAAELAALYPIPSEGDTTATWREVLLGGRVARESDLRLAAYRRAFQSAPAEPWPRVALAYELIARAKSATAKAAALVDDGAPALAGEAEARATVAWGEATTLVNSLRETHAQLPEVLLVDAALLEATGERAPALARARAAAELDPNLWRAHAAVARLLRESGDDAAAVQALERVLELAPRMGGAAAQLGRALLDLQRDAAARAALERAIALRPADAASRVNLAVALTRLGELDEAERIAASVATERPHDARVAEALRRIRRLREARGSE